MAARQGRRASGRSRRAEAWDALEEIAVAQLGPYWRRTATITAPVPRAAPEPPAGAEPPTTEEGGPRRGGGDAQAPHPDAARARAAGGAAPLPPPRVAWLATASVLAGAAAVAAFVVPEGRKPRPRAKAAPAPQRSATPYDFDGDGRQELVIALLRASPRGRSARSGVVLIHDSRGRKPAWQVVTESRAGLPGRPREGDDFGSGLASGDFDRDGYADLAIGTPGRERVSVLYGTSGGIDDRRTRQFPGGRADLPAGAGRYGFVLVADDLDGDRYDDLAIGAPGERDGEPSSGAVHVVFGGNGGLRSDRTRVIPRPDAGMANFGVRLRAGDIDGDRRPDLAEGARRATPRRGTRPTAAAACAGPHAATSCRPPGAPPASRSATSTATAAPTSCRATRSTSIRRTARRSAPGSSGSGSARRAVRARPARRSRRTPPRSPATSSPGTSSARWWRRGTWTRTASRR